VDLTPDRPIALAGYGSRLGQKASEVHDPVFARALYLETADFRVCIVATDLIGSLHVMRQDVRKAVADLKLDALILTATHNHSGPGALFDIKNLMINFTVGAYDSEWYAEMVKRLARSVRSAAEARRPARLALVSGEAPGLSRNRRSEHYPEGEAPVDPEVMLIEVHDAEDRPIALLTNFTAHGTVLSGKNMKVSGGWMGSYAREMEKRLPGCVALFVNGAEGDIAPRAPRAESDFERCDLLGAALADRVMEIRKGIEMLKKPVRINYRERGVTLPKRRTKIVPESTVFGVLEVGDSAFLCVPGELCVEIGLQLKKEYRERFGYRTASIFGLANDHLFYILTREQYRKGGYEQSMSFYGSKLGALLVDQFMEMGAERNRN